MESVYRIFMKTEMGKKEGTLVLRENGTMLSGTLDIMRSKNPLQGEKTGDSEGFFTGIIRTLMNELKYVITYTIKNNIFSGEAKTERGIFKIEGYKMQ